MEQGEEMVAVVEVQLGEVAGVRVGAHLCRQQARVAVVQCLKAEKVASRHP